MTRLSNVLERVVIGATALAAFTLAGCSESPSSPSREVAPDGPSLSQSPDVIDPTGRHVFHTKTWFDNQSKDSKPGGGGTTTTNTGIYYHGGPVLQSATNVVTIYWSNRILFVGGTALGDHGASSKDGSLVGDFLRRLGGSSYFNINSTYTDGQKSIANIVNYTATWANNDQSAPSGTQSVSDADMLAMLQNGLQNQLIPNTPNTLYAIFTDSTVNLGGGYTSPPQYCAYHSSGAVTVNGVQQTVLYAAMPYNGAYPAYCTSGYKPANGSRDSGADYEVNTLAHETEETTTDPLGTAWWDHRGYENADKCAWTWGTTFASNGGTANVTMSGVSNSGLTPMNFLIQRNWLNSGSGGCAQSH